MTRQRRTTDRATQIFLSRWGRTRLRSTRKRKGIEWRYCLLPHPVDVSMWERGEKKWTEDRAGYDDRKTGLQQKRPLDLTQQKRVFFGRRSIYLSRNCTPPNLFSLGLGIVLSFMYANSTYVRYIVYMHTNAEQGKIHLIFPSLFFFHYLKSFPFFFLKVFNKRKTFKNLFFLKFVFLE